MPRLNVFFVRLFLSPILLLTSFSLNRISTLHISPDYSLTNIKHNEFAKNVNLCTGRNVCSICNL
jgi:hypothetical protein